MRIFFYHDHWSIMLVRQIPVTGSVKEMHLYGANKNEKFFKTFFFTFLRYTAVSKMVLLVQ